MYRTVEGPVEESESHKLREVLEEHACDDEGEWDEYGQLWKNKQLITTGV